MSNSVAFNLTACAEVASKASGPGGIRRACPLSASPLVYLAGLLKLPFSLHTPRLLTRVLL